ncbi:MAG: carbohydrate ABC transporter permease [Firmicutes bacterium]|nr:carbohydrate ABC transporter permease [Bacillota bacterium]
MVRNRKREKAAAATLGREPFGFADVIIYLVLGLLVATMVIPFMNIVAISLSGYEAAVNDSSMLLPKDLTFSAYEIIFKPEIYRALGVTAFVTVANTLLHIILCMMLAYPLTKKDLPGRKFLMYFVLFPMLFSGGTIPFYILIRELHLSDNILVYILPGVVSAYTVILMRNFIFQIPDGLEEAALLDGANYFQILVRIVFPLSKPIIATMALFNAVGVWNNWFTGVLFVKDKNLLLIQNVLREMLIEGNMGAFGQLTQQQSYDTSVQMAAIVVSILPIVMVYPFIQRYFAKGMYIGSVKG